jgi:hypothetical protein
MFPPEISPELPCASTALLATGANPVHWADGIALAATNGDALRTGNTVVPTPTSTSRSIKETGWGGVFDRGDEANEEPGLKVTPRLPLLESN